ncbi:PleD family two-component system response regulator [Kangiella sp. TOML190]|uniref:response regulator n=1 Tax=Kangiella sp. TOML190 TaxID=2931351 RepID=UPI00203FCDDD|nr:response regulator [Kangiella sp. TOML190]
MSFFSKMKSLWDKPSNSSLESGSSQPQAQEAALSVPIDERRKKPRLNAVAGSKILIIDDSKTVCSMLEKMLQQNKYVTSSAYSAEEGLVKAQADRPDLIFLDIVLPEMDGFAALRAFRKNPETENIPIMMMSGNDQATEIFYASRIGADDFLKKPFSRYELFFRIEKLLDDERRLVRKQ